MELKLFGNYNWQVIMSRKRKSRKYLSKVKVGIKTHPVIHVEDTK